VRIPLVSSALRFNGLTDQWLTKISKTLIRIFFRLGVFRGYFIIAHFTSQDGAHLYNFDDFFYKIISKNFFMFFFVYLTIYSLAKYWVFAKINGWEKSRKSWKKNTRWHSANQNVSHDMYRYDVIHNVRRYSPVFLFCFQIRIIRWKITKE
jgi:hypothetical protein